MHPEGTGIPARRATAFAGRNVGVQLRSSDGLRHILDGIDLDIDDAEFVSVMGRSGTGKTTLLRVLAGLLEPTPSSTVTFHDQKVDGPPEGVGMVFQNYAASLLPWRTIERNVALGLEGRIDKPEMRRRVMESLAMVGLADRAADYPWQLSGGMQQRVQLARSLAMRPSSLLMDEPFGSLDAMTKASLQDELQRVHQRTRATIIFVTHDIDEALYLSDRILVLKNTPGTIGHDIAVELPRPRNQVTTKELPEYLRLRRVVYDEIMHGDN